VPKPLAVSTAVPSGNRWTHTAEGGLSGGFNSSWEKEQTTLMLLALSSAKKSVLQSRKARFSIGVWVGSITHVTP
jgi:hypothetical protein